MNAMVPFSGYSAKVVYTGHLPLGMGHRSEFLLHEPKLVCEIIEDTVPEELWAMVEVTLDDGSGELRVIPPEEWDYLPPPDRSQVTLSVVPGYQTLLVVIYVLQVIFTVLALVMTIVAMTRGTPKKAEPDNNASITGTQNRANPGGTIPRIYGRTRVFPPYAAMPYQEVIGSDVYLNCLFDFGFGPNKLSDFRIGDTAVGNFENILMEIREGWSTDEAITLYTTDVSATEQNLEVLHGTPQVLTTADETDEVIINIMWDEGLVLIDKKGQERGLAVDVKYEYRDNDIAGVWSTFSTLTVNSSAFPESAYVVGEKSITYSSAGVVANAVEVTLSCPSSWITQNGTTTGITEIAYSVAIKPTTGTGSTMPAPVQYGGEFYTWTDTEGALTDAIARGGYIVVPVGETRTVKLITPSLAPMEIVVTQTGFKADASSPALGGNALGGVRAFPAPTFLYQTTQSGDRTYRSAKLGTTYNGERFRFPYRGKWDVRITRVTPEYTDLTEKDTFHIIAFNSVRHSNPVSARVMNNHTLVAVRIKATDQLAGVIDEFSAVAESVLDTWDGSAWVKKPTRNPAWVFVDILTGSANAKRRSKDRIHIESVYAWAQQCESAAPQNSIPTGVRSAFNEPYHLFDGVFDREMTVFDALKLVTDVGRAEFAMLDGKYGVVQDVPRTTVVQYITPNNSWDFKGMKKFTENPEAVRIGWRDPNVNYQQSIAVVFEDGMNYSNTHNYEDMPIMFGVERASHVWRNGRYKLAKNRLEKDRYVVTMDVENLRCTKGDLVYLQHDVVKIGVTSGLVASVTRNGAGQIVSFESDRDVPMETGLTYGVRWRYYDISQDQANIVTVAGEQKTITLLTPFTDNGKMQRGDLFILGETDLIGLPVIVDEIRPLTELQSEVFLKTYDTNIYTADGGVLPANAITSGRDLAKAPGPVVRLTAVEQVVYNGTSPSSNVILTWNPPSSGGYPQFYEVYSQEGITGEYKKVGAQIIATRFVMTNVVPDVPLTIRVIAIGASRNSIAPTLASSVTITPDGDVDQPDRPNNLDAQSMPGAVLIRFTNPTDLPDLISVKVYASATNDFGTASLVGQATTTSDTNTGQFMHYTGIGGVFRYYWATAVDSSENESAPYPDPLAGIPGQSLALTNDNPFPQVFWDPFDKYIDGAGVLTAWEVISGTGELSISTDAADGVDGNKALVVGNNAGNDSTFIIAKQSVSFDPAKLYRVQFYIRDKITTTGTVSLGVAGRNASDNAWVNSAGANSTSSQHAFAASARDPVSGYTVYTGYFLGRDAAPSAGESTDPTVPGKLHTDARYFRPFINFASGGGVGQIAIDSVRVDIVDDIARSAFDLAATAQETADGKITSFYQSSPPSGDGELEGDLWFDTDDGNKVYRYNGSSWVVSQDQGIAQAISDAATAQSTADGKIITFVTSDGGVSPPVGASTGDLWFDSVTRKLRRYKVGVGTTVGFDFHATLSYIDNFSVYLTSNPSTNLLLGDDPGFSNSSNNAKWTLTGIAVQIFTSITCNNSTVPGSAELWTTANLVDGQNYTFKFDHDIGSINGYGIKPWYRNTLGDKVYLTTITSLAATANATYSFTAVNPIQDSGGGGWTEVVATYNIGNLADKDTVGTPDIDPNAVQQPVLSETTSSVTVPLLPSYATIWSMNFTTVSSNLQLEFFFSAYCVIPNNSIQGTNASLYAEMRVDGVLRTVPFPTNTRMQGLREMDEGSDESVFLMWHAPVTIPTAGAHTIEIKVSKGDNSTISINNRRIWALVTKGV